MPWGYAKHTTEGITHNHPWTNQTKSFTPTYYALTFIMRAPTAAGLTVADSADWDLLVAANQDVTIHLWAKTPATLSANAEQIIGQYVDATHHWALVKDASTNKLNFLMNGDSNVAASAVSTGTAYHIAICKVGTDIGVYLDGTQIIYDDLTGIDTSLSEVLGIAGRYVGSSGSLGCEWYLDEVVVVHENVFNAAPVVGLTDTITPPTAMVTWESFA
jgi:hypothetical protein